MSSQGIEKSCSGSVEADHQSMSSPGIEKIFGYNMQIDESHVDVSQQSESETLATNIGDQTSMDGHTHELDVRT